MVPWNDAGHFWKRVEYALTKIPRLQGEPRFTPSKSPGQVEVILLPEESEFLRAYYREMVESGGGRVIGLTKRNGIHGHQLIPFFSRLDGLERPPAGEAAYPWADFPARCQELSGGRHAPPTFAVRKSKLRGDRGTIPDREKGPTRMASRLFAIGDIHGCNLALKALIAAIGPKPDDTVVVLGDVIDWGPDSRDCVQQLIELSARCKLILVRGNHEEMLFAALESQSELRYWLNFGGEETLKSYPYRGGEEFVDRDHVRFLKDQARDYYETDEFIFVHACYDPNKPMDQQSNTTLQWEPVQPDQMRPHFSGKAVIAGHTPQISGEPLDLGFLKVIDTDCSRGGWLTALEVRGSRIIQADRCGKTRTLHQ